MHRDAVDSYQFTVENGVCTIKFRMYSIPKFIISERSSRSLYVIVHPSVVGCL